MTETAKVYADSLYELMRDEGAAEEALTELRSVNALFAEEPRYLSLLSVPSLPKAERCGIVDESLKGRIHPYLLNFIKILVENGTIRTLSDCEKAYRKRFYDDNGILEITAVTAVPLSDELRERLTGALSERLGKKIALTARVDDTVLGGVRLETDNIMIDGTVRSRLRDIGRILSETVL